MRVNTERQRATMYRQGNQWIVSTKSPSEDYCRTSGPMDYWHARNTVGRANCRRRNCTIHDHKGVESCE